MERRMLSAVLALALCLSTLPGRALAAEGGDSGLRDPACEAGADAGPAELRPPVVRLRDTDPRQTRTETLVLTNEDQGSPEQGWSWKQDPANEGYYTFVYGNGMFGPYESLSRAPPENRAAPG